MDEKLKQAFDLVKADEKLKKGTVEYVLRKSRNRTAIYIRKFAVAASAAAVVSLGAVGAFFSTVTVISIDVNPSVELGVNRFDRVVSVEGMNDDGTRLAENLDVKYETYAEAVERVLDSLKLSEDDVVSITVAGSDDSKNNRMIENVRSCASEYHQTHCYSANITDAEQEQAHQAGLSCGKYRAYLELQELNPGVTTDDVQDMSMREIQDEINSIISSHHEEDHAPEHGTISNGGNGAGEGTDNGSENGNGAAAGTTAAGAGSCNGEGHHNGHSAKYGHGH